MFFNYQIGVSADAQGNVGLQHSFTGGLTTIAKPSTSFSTYNSISNAPNIRKIESSGANIGGSLSLPLEKFDVIAGGDVDIIEDPNNGKTYYGLTVSGGVGKSQDKSPLEGHVDWGQTWTIGDFNVFDVGKGIYTKIMEW